jgi:hypothetical protein
MSGPLHDRPEKWNWLHRDADGNGLLVGPNCPDCERRAVARYRCLVCSQTFDIPGVFRWSWQGKGHWHEPDDENGWHRTITEHLAVHDGEGGFVPTGEATT